MGTLSRCGLEACAVVGLAAGTAGAGIVYTDIPDVIAGQIGLVDPLDIDRDGVGDVQPSSVFSPEPGMQAIGIGQTRLMQDVWTQPSWDMRAYAPSELIGDEPGWAMHGVLFHSGFGVHYGAWLEPGEKFCGVRLERGGQFHFGWIRVSTELGVAGVRFHDFAYESDPGVPIAAGAVPGAGTLGGLVALACIPGSRRREGRGDGRAYGRGVV